MQRSDFRCFHRLRVRWSEVDIQKIVFNAHYLTYADCAMTEYWRALALPYETGMQALGGEVYLKKASVEYHASARLDDLLDPDAPELRTRESFRRFFRDFDQNKL